MIVAGVAVLRSASASPLVRSCVALRYATLACVSLMAAHVRQRFSDDADDGV